MASTAGVAAPPGPVGAEAAGVRLALMGVRLNEIEQPDPVWVLRSGESVSVTAATAKGWRLRTEAVAVSTFEGDSYVALPAIPGVTVVIDEVSQTLAVTAAPAAFESSNVMARRDTRGPMTRSAPGAFFNYDVSGQVASGATALRGLFEIGAFSGGGTALTGFIAGVGDAGRGARSLIRLESNWTIDDPARMRSLRIGDGVTRGSTGTSSLRFAGIQLASNFATQPGFLTMALPTLSGSAAVPSVVDVYVNTVLQTHQTVAPGPFTLTDVPVVNGSGDVQLVVRDALGRETMVTQAYYAAPQIIRRGLHDYAYEAGVLRRNFAAESNDYGAAVVSATHRYGVTDTLTVEGHGEATLRTQAVSAAIAKLWPAVGVVSVSGAGSQSDRGTGGLLGLGFERQTHGLSIGGSGEITTKHYATIGDTASYRRARSTVTAFLAMPTPLGSVGGSLLWRQGPDQPDILYATANASMRIGGIGALGLSGRQSFAGARDSAVRLYLSVPLGGRTSATVGTEVRNGQLGATMTAQRNLPFGEGIGYRLQAETGAIERISTEVSAQSDLGRLDAEVTWRDGASGARLQLNGSVATVGGQVFAARRLDQSFGAVQVGDYADVRVYADNQLIGRTNGAGTLIVPRLRPFQDNRIRIEAEDLPLDAVIDETVRTVRPYDRSGVSVRFAARDAQDATLTVVQPGGAPLPAGTALYVNGGSTPVVVAPGGLAYLTGLVARNTVRAVVGQTPCRFEFAFAAHRAMQPDLGKFTCAP